MPPIDPPDGSERLLTKHDVAERLSVSVRTIERLYASGDLKAIRVGGSVRFHPADVTNYIERLRSSDTT